MLHFAVTGHVQFFQAIYCTVQFICQLFLFFFHLCAVIQCIPATTMCDARKTAVVVCARRSIQISLLSSIQHLTMLWDRKQC